MSAPSRIRARRLAVVPDEPLLRGVQSDYADAFEIREPVPDPRTAEEFARCALETSARPVRWTIHAVHRHVLRLQLAPLSSSDHVLGWRVETSEPDVVHLTARSPLLGRASIVGRRVDTTIAITTSIVYTRPRAARAVWTVVGPLHRRIAPYLLERAAAASPGAATRS